MSRNHRSLLWCMIVIVVIKIKVILKRR